MICRYSNTLNIAINNIDKTITFNKCCVLADNKEKFISISFDEYNAKPNGLTYDELKGYFDILPENHNITPGNHSFCEYAERCDWRGLPLKSVAVDKFGCNIKCKMCTAKQNPADHISTEIYFNILESLKGHQLEDIRLTVAGEPFLEKQRTIDYICSLTANDTKKLRVITNATLLTRADIDRLADAASANGVTLLFVVSLHSLNVDTYKEIERNSYFNKVIDNINYMKLRGILDCINIVALPENINELYDMCLYWHNRGIWCHILPVRYLDILPVIYNGTNPDVTEEYIEQCKLIATHENLLRIKNEFPQYYGDS